MKNEKDEKMELAPKTPETMPVPKVETSTRKLEIKEPTEAKSMKATA